MTDTQQRQHLHLDDCPEALGILRALFSRRVERAAEIGYERDAGRPELRDLVGGELVDRAEREQARLDDAHAVTAAEGVVVDARSAELQAARRRLAAAQGLLTKARKDGAADKIAAAWARVDAAEAHCDRVGRDHIAELQALVAGRQANLDELSEQIDRSWAASRDVTKALSPLDVDDGRKPA